MTSTMRWRCPADPHSGANATLTRSCSRASFARHAPTSCTPISCMPTSTAAVAATLRGAKLVSTETQRRIRSAPAPFRYVETAHSATQTDRGDRDITEALRRFHDRGALGLRLPTRSRRSTYGNGTTCPEAWGRESTGRRAHGIPCPALGLTAHEAEGPSTVAIRALAAPPERHRVGCARRGGPRREGGSHGFCARARRPSGRVVPPRVVWPDCRRLAAVGRLPSSHPARWGGALRGLGVLEAMLAGLARRRLGPSGSLPELVRGRRDGAVLVRPDDHVGARASEIAARARAATTGEIRVACAPQCEFSVVARMAEAHSSPVPLASSGRVRPK